MRSKERILIIDDSLEIVKHMTQRLLPSFGYEVLHAYDGRSGLDLIRSEKPDAVVLDLNLPQMTGLDVLESLALESNDVPVVLMTGYGSEKSAIEAFRLGVRDYIVKPFTSEEVKNSLGRVLSEAQEKIPTPVTESDVKRAYSEMRGRVKEMNTVFAIGKAICSVLSTEKVIERALQAAIYLTNTEVATLWLADGTGYALRRGNMRTVQTLDPAKPDPNVMPIFLAPKLMRRSIFMGNGIETEGEKFARSVCYVPLTQKDDVLGVLSVSHRVAPTAISQKDENMLAALTDYVTVALNNAQRVELRGEAVEFPTVNNPLVTIAQAITTGKEIDTIADDALAQLVATGAVNAAQLWLLNENRDAIRLVTTAGVPRLPLEAKPIPLGDGMVSRVIKTDAPLVTNDLIGYPIPVPTLDKLDLYIDSILTLPLTVRGEVIGALELCNKPFGDFDQADIDTFIPVANAMSLAIYNTMLHHRAAAQQKQLEVSLEQANFPIILVNAHGEIVLENGAATDLVGLQNGKGTLLENSLPAGELRAFVQQSPSIKNQYSREIKLNEKPYRATLVPVNGFGRVLSLHDVSAAQELDDAKTDFIRTLSYDLRSPLTTVSGFATSLGNVGDLNNQQQIFAKRIESESQRMLRMVNGLLDLARVASRAEQVREPVALEELTEFVVDRLYMETNEKNVIIDVETVGNARRIEADSAQIYKAIENMLMVAVAASPDNAAVKVQLIFADDSITIAVRDEGKGVKSADLPHLFDKFYRRHGQDEDSGLGLALVNAVATGHGGRAWAENGKPSGTILSIKLPI